MREIFARSGVALTDDDWAFFERLRQAVIRGNERMNLTRLVEPADFLLKHVLDSLLPFAAVPALRDLPPRLRAADLGSGAGFPGLALARMRPGWRIALVERTRKKAAFLAETVAELGLANASVVATDAREAAELRGRCELVTARAVGRLDEVTRAAAPLLAPHAIVVHYKGGALEEGEIEAGRRAADKLGLVQEAPVAYDLPPDARRSVVLSRASGRTRTGSPPATRARGRSRGGRER